MNQKGLASTLIILIIVGVLVLGGGIYYAVKKFQKPTVQICTQEAKQCSDGSYVSRIPPNCEFSSCPEVKKDETADWKTYRNEDLMIVIKYPEGWNIDDYNGKIRFFSNDNAIDEENCKKIEQGMIDQNLDFGPTGCKFGVFISTLVRPEIEKNYYDVWIPYTLPDSVHTEAFQLNRDYLPPDFAVGIPLPSGGNKFILFEAYNIVNSGGILTQMLSTFRFLE